MRYPMILALLLSACVAEDDDATESSHVDVTQRGIDYAWSRPSSPQALHNAGYSFVVRYLSYDTTGKNLSAGELTGLFAAGIDVVANWEWGAGDALNGYATGRSQAQRALEMATQLGMPADRPIYFSVDIDASASQQAAIDAYFDGVISVMGIERTGAYGGYYVIKRLFDHGKIRWGWQTYAWSGGQWDGRAQLRQVQNGVVVAGADCDIDTASVADFGQWGPNAGATVAEGSRVYVTPNQQHLMTVDASGALRHVWWDGAAGALARDTWGTGVVGKPATFVTGSDQHAFARGSGGALEHWFWTPSTGIRHDTWAAGLAGDPAVMLIGNDQHVFAVDGAGKLQHWWWGPTSNGVRHDTWGSGAAGRPSVLAYRGQHHAFARGTGGALEHWWWDRSAGISHDTWANGLAGDPAALPIGEFQDVWAVDGAGQLQHWWWGPSTNGVRHDTWGAGVVGRPSVMTAGPQQHVFVRGTGGTLEHFWWDPDGGIEHDTWGSGITGDPVAKLIGAQQHVWAQDASGAQQHWFWDPATDTVRHDTWALQP